MIIIIRKTDRRLAGRTDEQPNERANGRLAGRPADRRRVHAGDDDKAVKLSFLMYGANIDACVAITTAADSYGEDTDDEESMRGRERRNDGESLILELLTMATAPIKTPIHRTARARERGMRATSTARESLP